MGGIYLSKSGNTFGPFTDEQLVEMRESGELRHSGYEWIWSESTGRWDPILHQSPPPPPTQAPSRDVSGKRLFHVPDELAQTLEVVCYDQLSVLSGRVRKAGDSGCEFIASSQDAGPLFMKDKRVKLNLLDPKSGATMSVEARVMLSLRQDGRWSYRLSWAGCPEILLQTA